MLSARMCAQLLQLRLTFCDPMDCSLPGSSVHAILGKDTVVGCHALLQGILPTQGLNLHLRSPALAYGFFTTVPPGKPPHQWWVHFKSMELKEYDETFRVHIHAWCGLQWIHYWSKVINDGSHGIRWQRPLLGGMGRGPSFSPSTAHWDIHTPTRSDRVPSSTLVKKLNVWAFTFIVMHLHLLSQRHRWC